MTTLAQKLIAKAAGKASVEVGDIAVAKVDLALIHDSGGPRRVEPILQKLGAELFDKRKVILVSDHFYPGDDKESSQILEVTRQWASQRDVKFYHGEGICHVVLPEHGHLKPGMFAVGGDSHSCTGGAFGAYMFGIGATEMAGVLATGEIWVKVPETILIEWHGALNQGVCAKDMMLYLCGQIGMDGGRYQAIEYCGNTIQSLPMQERMTLSNMSAELGAQVGLIAGDNVTHDYLGSISDDYLQSSGWHTDSFEDADVHYRFDASSLEPQVAAPNSPANAAPISDYSSLKLDVAYIGSCTGAKYQDMSNAAKILRHQKVSSSVELRLAPASRLDQQRAEHDGILKILVDAGATLYPNACGICAGYGVARLGENSVCLSTTARNFKGRMGAASSRVYLASPYTVAASAITGRLTHPGEFLETDRA
jgi:3-isopropylmalate/(R)-2-methylmalate dehydratase large subunit